MDGVIKHFRVSDENLGVSDENQGVSDKNHWDWDENHRAWMKIKVYFDETEQGTQSGLKAE